MGLRFLGRIKYWIKWGSGIHSNRRGAYSRQPSDDFSWPTVALQQWQAFYEDRI